MSPTHGAVALVAEEAVPPQVAVVVAAAVAQGRLRRRSCWSSPR